ncbi:MAG TPA: hypothetical protein VFT53_03135 [Candidatus Saccharimonadales bacterium]|nr:hypothetical protein [Candidatus Saccharimonadales bacterium]
MGEVISEQSTPKHRANSGLIILCILAVIGLGLIGSWYLYHIQNSKVESLAQTKASLDKQAANLSGQLASAQSASNISTANWKTYCDHYGNLCFSYPSGWSLSSNHSDIAGLSGLGMGTATLTNPSKTLSVSYLDDYIKDDFPANFIVNSVTPLDQAGKGLIALGGYYVAAGGHFPLFTVVNSSTDSNGPSTSNKAGQNITTAVVPLFEYSYGAQTALGQFTISGKNVPTTEQADAWFNSVDGKTALAMVKTFASGSTYTGKYLNIPELGIRMKLTYNTQDAYYAIRNSSVQGQPPYVLLSVHSLDQYLGCTTSQNNDGVAGISTFTKGETDPVYGYYGKTFPDAPLINGRYYFVTGDQYDCTEGGASALHSDVRGDFIKAYSTIEAIPKN